MRSTLAALLSLWFLAACDSSVGSLRELTLAAPHTDPFYAAAADQYRDYSQELMESYAWWTSKYFADKGLLAAYGQALEPEDPARWDLPADQLPEFEQMRMHVIAAIAEHAPHDPVLAATVLVNYDRWLELQNNNWNIPAIAGARETFYATLEALAAAPATSAAPQKKRTTNTRKPAESLLQSVVETTSAVLYFPMDHSGLTESARAALNGLIDYIKNAGPVNISINGHADRVGEDAYNLQLSQMRARYVMQALEQAGIPDSAMQYFAFGETDPKVATPDEVAEPHNRRVEIYLE